MMPTASVRQPAGRRRRGARKRPGVLLVVLVLAVIAAGCGDDSSSVAETSSATPVPQTTAQKSLDGLDCDDDVRMATIVEPAEGFAGHGTPEEAVLAIAAVLPATGTPEHVADADWVIRTSDGRAIARTEVGPWGEGWFAGEITACDDGEHGS